jgi:murein DD-endopeptidase MepM/ murein hydrolase activator NlpD
MKNKKNLITVIFVAAILVIAFSLYWLLSDGADLEEYVELPAPPPVLEYGLPVDSFLIEEYIIQPDTYLSDVLYRLGATPGNVACVGALGKGDFDVRKVRAGNRCKAFYSGIDSTRILDYFVYEKNPVEYCVFCFTDSFRVYHGKKPTNIRRKYSRAEITSSLWNATVENNISPMLALNLSDIFAWTIDFFGLQKGDKFTVLYDEVYIDTTLIEIGRIHAAEFVSGGKIYYSYYFEQDGVGSYWDEDGNSLKRSFLKAPLKFSRISSHFSYARKHPVFRIVRPHTGVDYAAPAGTPVMSIGDGTVIAKGFNGGGGHTVKIRHNSVYTTAYLHLSKYGEGIHVGNRVSQGQVIGYVGSTGTSTGPHLDFRVWMNGRPVNPLTIESPPVEPISNANKEVFDSVRVNYKKELTSGIILQ